MDEVEREWITALHVGGLTLPEEIWMIVLQENAKYCEFCEEMRPDHYWEKCAFCDDAWERCAACKSRCTPDKLWYIPFWLCYCSLCEKMMCKECAGHCADGMPGNYCGEKWFCPDHLFECECCGESRCEKHAVRCDECGDFTCGETALHCKVCDKLLCEKHYAKDATGTCAGCQAGGKRKRLSLETSPHVDPDIRASSPR